MSLTKSNWGYMFSEVPELSEAERIIFEDVMKSMILVNHNLRFVLPQVIAYCQEMAMYQKIMKQIGDNIMNEDGVPHPSLRTAKERLVLAIDLAKQLGLTLKSRQQIQQGPEPEKKIPDAKKEFLS